MTFPMLKTALEGIAIQQLKGMRRSQQGAEEQMLTLAITSPNHRQKH